MGGDGAGLGRGGVSQLSSPGFCLVEGRLTMCRGSTLEESLVLSGL